MCALLAAFLSPHVHAQVECWAPGMPTSVTLGETSRSTTVSLGRPYRYDVFGVAGSLTLGNRAANALVLNNQFRQRLLGLIPAGSVVNSTAYVRLQTGLTQFYSEQLAVSSAIPGTSIGPRYQYGPNWTLCDPRNPTNVSLTFHLAGSGLLSSLVPGLLSPAYYNLNPTGYFYVLGEYHAAPPVMTGELAISGTTALHGSSLEVAYGINREELPPVFRPPFLGLDLGDLNLTVIGSPPAQPDLGTGAGIDLPDIETPELLSIAIDLSGSQGNGWIKFQRTP